jgi:beta-lactamase family protein
MAFALPVEMPAHVDPPAIVAPASREVSFGRVAGTVGPGVHRVVVLVNGEETADQDVERGRFELRLALPPRDSVVRVVAEDALGNSAGRSVESVFGLPVARTPTAPRSYEDGTLARKIRRLTRSFPGTSGIYVENVTTGAGGAWNARARFPAASSVKIAIAIEVMRVLDARPPPGSSLAELLDLMLVHSDNVASNELLEWLGGSELGGAAEVNETMAALGLEDSYMYGGYLISSAGGPPIPLTVESQPAFEGKYTTAWDLAQLHRGLYLAARGGGPLIDDLSGSFTSRDARFLLYVLARSADEGKLDRFMGSDVVVPHKAGWVSEARHDSGVVYSPDATFVVSVMTWNAAGAGASSDVLAGRVAHVALRHFQAANDSFDPTAGFSLRL